MPDSPLTTVARFDTQGEAQLAKTKLEDAGIPCMLSNEDQSGLIPFYNSTEGGVQVKVPTDQADAARSFLGRD